MELTKGQQQLAELIYGSGVEWCEDFPYAAQDCGGDVYGYDYYPNCFNGVWDCGSSFTYLASSRNPFGNYSDTILTFEQYEFWKSVNKQQEKEMNTIETLINDLKAIVSDLEQVQTNLEVLKEQAMAELAQQSQELGMGYSIYFKEFS